MKRLWVAVALLALSVAVCVWSQVTIKQASAEMLLLVEEVMTAAEKEDFETANEKSKKLGEIWDKYYTRFTMLKNHEEIHDLMVSVNLINDATHRNDAEKTHEICSEALIQIKHLRESEKINFGNVF